MHESSDFCAGVEPWQDALTTAFSEDPAFVALRGIVSERTRGLIVWIGSGLSVDAGLPTWAGLKNVLVDAAYRKASSMDDDSRKRRESELSSIKSSVDYWADFERLSKQLGPTSFNAEIRAALVTAASCSIPLAYELVWRLNSIEGVLTLNLDRLAARGFASARGSELVVERSGEQISQLRRIIHGGQPFIGNLHGNIDEAASWVLTRSQLSAITGKPDYRNFIQACLSDCVNLFIGIDIRDIAVGGHLDRIAQGASERTESFWITHYRDESTDSWAEERGIRVIRYSTAGAKKDDHSPLLEMLKELVAHVSAEVIDAPPVGASVNLAHFEAPENTLSRDQLERLSSNDLRLYLNNKAKEILNSGKDEAYHEYEAFSREHDELIYRAWYTSDSAGNNFLLGYTLQQEIARGAFGRVYRAQNTDGRQVALKVLLDEVRRDPSLLASFRRGVRSMRILRDSRVEGMVGYIDASEIPAFVVMDWIDGPNLVQAYETRQLTEWPTILEVARQIVRIIRAAHSLPARVLHRDLRPANIMLRDFWVNHGEIDVVVLDFDLSWHRGSAERSIVFTTASGYLAPEQQMERAGESTRSAVVDSFGLGMTLYFMISGQDPPLNQHLRQDWPKQILNYSQRVEGSGNWASIPSRFARIVEQSTQDSQKFRWDLARIEREIQQLQYAVLGKPGVDAELLAEEVAVRSGVFVDYSWDEDIRAAVFQSPSGLSVSVSGSSVDRTVSLKLSYVLTGTEDRKRVGEQLSNSLGRVRSSLEGVWKVGFNKIEQGSYRLEASATSTEVERDLKKFSDSLGHAITRAS